jgi:hypothetical protein
MDPMPTDYYDVFEGPLTGEHGCVPPPFGIGTGRVRSDDGSRDGAGVREGRSPGGI